MAFPPPPYADAVCGTHVCGEAICGAWWAYPATSGVAFGATPPIVDVIEGEIVPSAGLALGATAPGLSIGNRYTPPSAGLALGATPPTAVYITSILSPPSAGLAFGASVPDRATQEWMTIAECEDAVLQEDQEIALVLVGAPSYSLDLDSEECR